MAKVTIEGSISPSAYLPRGERREVPRTDHIERLIRGGFVNVIEDDGDVVPTPLPEPVKAPARNSSAETWRAFLAEQGVEHDPDLNRDELVDAYDDYLSTHDAPAAED